jgi:hypothetical protein
VEIVAMDALINAAGRRGPESDAYKVNATSIRSNIQGRWIVDNDPFGVNQMMHPYQGAMYHNIARSSGLNYWQSLAYTFAGSIMWEIAGETTTPAVNDQLASGIAGTLLGESLFRMANLLVDRSHEQRRIRTGIARVPGFAADRDQSRRVRQAIRWRHADARPRVRPSRAIRWRAARQTTRRARRSILGAARRSRISWWSIGLPGRAGYTYTRPFDYFRLDATASSVDIIEKVTSHGVLAGRR